MGGVVKFITGDDGSKAAKKEAERAKKERDKMLREQAQAEDQAKTEREGLLRAATTPGPSLFDVLGSPQQKKNTLG